MYGLVVAGAPKLAPSTRNCTLAMPTELEALATTLIVPETVAPFVGEVIETVGGVPEAVVNVMSPLVA